jgi:hypothetical protein
MTDTSTGNATDFFIREQMVRIRPVSAGDQIAGKTLQSIVADSDYDTFGTLSVTHEKPLAELIDADDAVVHAAFLQEDEIEDSDDTYPLALCMAVTGDAPTMCELTMVVSRDFLDTRLPFEIASTLLTQAADKGAMTVTTTDDTSNIHMRALAEKLGMSVRMVPDGNGRIVRYTAQTDQHPGIVKL